jgi:hypothetical protein
MKKIKNTKRTSLYITILRDVRNKLEITNNEYYLCSLIEKLSLKTGFVNWVPEYFAAEVGVSEYELDDILINLIEKKLLWVDKGTKHLSVTELFTEEL